MQIDIGTVLKKFDDTVDEVDQSVKEYGVRFITAKGYLRTMRARKNTKYPHLQISGTNAKARNLFNLKLNGTMLVEDLALNEPRAVKVACITHFKDFNSSTWATVYH